MVLIVSVVFGGFEGDSPSKRKLTPDGSDGPPLPRRSSRNRNGAQNRQIRARLVKIQQLCHVSGLHVLLIFPTQES